MNKNEWLNQFPMGPDRQNAKLLLDGLIYIDNNELYKGLTNLLDSFYNDTQKTIALFAVREPEQIPYFPSKEVPPGRVSNKPLGSEADIAHFIRDISKTNKNFLDHPSLNNMKERKCCHIIFLDDICASGTRVSKFAEWFLKNKTIKSWLSFKWIDINVCTYAMTEAGKKYILSSKFLYENKLMYQMLVKKGSPKWSDEETQSVINLCKSYGTSFLKSCCKDFLLGYKNAFTFIIFEHKCPNTVPAILWDWHIRKDVDWKPLFQQRPIFNDEKFPIQKFFIFLKRKKARILSSRKFEKLNDDKKNMLLILEKLSVSKKYFMNNSFFEIPKWLFALYKRRMLNLRWIDSNDRITSEGKDILKYFRKKSKEINKPLEIKPDYYYPNS